MNLCQLPSSAPAPHPGSLFFFFLIARPPGPWARQCHQRVCSCLPWVNIDLTPSSSSLCLPCAGPSSPLNPMGHPLNPMGRSACATWLLLCGVQVLMKVMEKLAAWLKQTEGWFFR